MKKRLSIALALLALLTTYKPQKIFLSEQFDIKEIVIENNFILSDKQIKEDLFFLYNNNLIFVNSSNIKKILKKENFISSFEIKKIYPNKIKIKIFEKKPIAILQQKKEKFYISENIDLIDYLDLENYKNLPIVFGDKKNFEELYQNLKKINFPLKFNKKILFI
jgi:cell division protein FtsQ